MPNKMNRILFVLAVIFITVQTVNVVAEESPTEKVRQIAESLRLNRFYDKVENEKRISEDLYTADFDGLHILAILNGSGKVIFYHTKKGNWIAISKCSVKAPDVFFTEVSADLGYMFFSEERTHFKYDDSLPEEVKNAVKNYFNPGYTVNLEQGTNIFFIWDLLNKTEGPVKDALSDIGLMGSGFIDKVNSRQKILHPAAADGGWVVTGTYNHILMGDTILNLRVDLGALPEIENRPPWLNLPKSEEVALRIRLNLDFGLKKPVDVIDEDFSIEFDNTIEIEGKTYDFACMLGVRRQVIKQEMTNVDLGLLMDEDAVILFSAYIEGELKDGVWEDAFGLKGVNLEEVLLKGSFYEDGSITIGLAGQINYGKDSQLRIGCTFPINEPSIEKVNGMASVSRIDFNQLDQLTHHLAGTEYNPSDHERKLKEGTYLRDAEFSFASMVSDADVGVQQQGIYLRGAGSLLGHEVGRVELRISPQGFWTRDELYSISFGNLDVKKAYLSIFVPTGAEETWKLVKNAVLKNATQLFDLDLETELFGQKENLILKYGLTGMGGQFDANVTEGIGIGCKLFINTPGIFGMGKLFDVGFYLHTGDLVKLENMILGSIGDSIKELTAKGDKTLSDAIAGVESKKAELTSALNDYDDARKQALQDSKNATNALDRAQNYLRKEEDVLSSKKNAYHKWKRKRKNTNAFWHPKAYAEAVSKEDLYNAEYNTARGIVKAARGAVSAIKQSTEFIPVDAYPGVVEKFAVYNGAKFALAVAEGTLKATKEVNGYVANLTDEISKGTNPDLTIESISFSSHDHMTTGIMQGVSMNISGKYKEQEWTISPEVFITSAKHIAEVAADNLTKIKDELVQVAKAVVSTANDQFSPADYTEYPKDTVLSYSWERLPGKAYDIAIAGEKGNELVFVTSGDGITNGQMYKWNHERNDWDQFEGLAVNVSVNAKGDLWVVNSGGAIYYCDVIKAPGQWIRIAGAAKDIAVGPNGKVWITNINNNIFKFKEGQDPAKSGGIPGDQLWDLIAGKAARLAVDPEGKSWVINDAGGIYYRKGNHWIGINGVGRDVGVGADNSVWMTSSDDSIWGRHPKTEKWVKISGKAQKISVDGEGNPWVVNGVGAIYRNTGPVN